LLRTYRLRWRGVYAPAARTATKNNLRVIFQRNFDAHHYVWGYGG
jgi:hypothetical protein